MRFTVIVLLWWTERIVVTDKRMMLSSGIITHRLGMMPLSKVTDLTFERTVAGRMLGYGTVIVESAGPEPGVREDQVRAAPGGGLRGHLRDDLRRPGSDPGHRRAAPAPAQPAALAALTAGSGRRRASGLASGVTSAARIDLHTHSTASDGTDSPAELVTAARAAGVDVLAITDHDTTAGWDEAAAALPAGLRLLRGAEFSCVSPTGRGDRDVSVHLLGYLFDPEHEAIVAEQTRLRTERRHRLHRIAEKMAADGYPVDPDGLLALLPAGTSAGRPHLARALVTAGVVDSVNEAFATLLYNGSPYYVPKADTPVRDRDPDAAGGRRGAGLRAPVRPPPRAAWWSRR